MAMFSVLAIACVIVAVVLIENLFQEEKIKKEKEAVEIIRRLRGN